MLPMTDNHWLLLGVFAVLAVLIVFRRLRRIPTAKARRLIAEGALVLDVRTSQEFASGHARGAVNLPVEQARRRITEIEPDRSRTILTYCHSGTRSAITCRILRGLGYQHAHNLGSLGRARAVAGR
jgi:rhodanese-related sulfurtransferase